ncbi:hypothetical protein [Methylocystis sp.]|nr:hypothetical protein [Methylocystis sp.]
MQESKGSLQRIVLTTKHEAIDETSVQRRVALSICLLEIKV